MDSASPSPNRETEPKAEFRKLTNEAANRKYRRRSPIGGSSDDDGSPKRNYNSRKVSENERRNDDRMDDKNSSQSYHGRGSDSYRHSSRGYHNRHDDSSRHGKHAEDERAHTKSSSRSSRESRGGNHSEHRGRDNEYNRSRDHHRDVDRYSRDRYDDADRKHKDKDLPADRSGYDGKHTSRYDDRVRHARGRDDRVDKRDYRSSRDYKSERTMSSEGSGGRRGDSTSKKETSDVRNSGGSKYSDDVRTEYSGLDKRETGFSGGGKPEDRSGSVREDFAAKKPKLFNLEESDGKNADERQSFGSKHGDEFVARVASVEAPVAGSDTTTNAVAAKIAAMKAAELVNQNLVGTGFMTADQKKKLLWGSKKVTNTEESSRRWDTAQFSDRERQEKFNKLMGVKSDVKVDSKPASSQDVEKQREQLQMDLEKQYTAGLRRRDGRTVGLGL